MRIYLCSLRFLLFKVDVCVCGCILKHIEYTLWFFGMRVLLDVQRSFSETNYENFFYLRYAKQDANEFLRRSFVFAR